MAKRDKKKPVKRKGAPKEVRRLSVVMFTDMVGYSAMTQKDESSALRLLEEHRAILRPLFAKHGGKEIKTIGDAFLVEFSSALEASSCAVAIQNRLNARNQASSDTPPIQIRIGLHVGDVVFKERDVYGDGVNIASRIEPLAEPGGICISEDVARQIQNKIEYPLIRLGMGDLKNIDLPVGIYRIVLPWMRKNPESVERLKFFVSRKSVRRYATLGAVIVILSLILLWTSLERTSGPLPRKNIAVLPLTNIGAAQSQEYFTDGMTEELISNLAKIRDLSVIAGTSVSKYKSTQRDIAQIGRELNVGSVLEGSVQTSDGRARIIVNLIDANDQHNLWSQKYERDLKDLFDVQSDIAMSVVQALQAELLSGERERIAKKATDNSLAHDLYLQGLSHLNKRTGDEIIRAIDFFSESVRNDSSFALAFAGLSECYALVGSSGYGSIPRDEAVNKAKYFAARAITLDPSQAEAHTSLGYVKFRIDWDWAGAEQEFKRALSLEPGFARAHEWYGLYLSIVGRFDEALAEMRRAHQLDPLSPSVSTGIGRILHFDHRFEDAVSQFKETIAAHDDYAEAHFGLGMTYSAMRRFEEAQKELLTAKKLSGDRPIVTAMIGVNDGWWGKKKEALEIIRQFDSSRDKNVNAYYRGLIYASINDLDRAMVEIERAYRQREGLLVYGNAEPMFGNLKADPRFQALLEKMGLPQARKE